METQNQILSQRTLISRDGPDLNVDPALVYFCDQSWPVLLISIIFHFMLYKSNRANKRGRRNLPVIFRGGAIACNIALITFMCVQWGFYLVALLDLEREFPVQTYGLVSYSLVATIVFGAINACFVLLTLLALRRPTYLLRQGPSRIDEEHRHSGDHGDQSLPDTSRYGQNGRSWIVHFILVFTWLLTAASAQSKLPGATFANMPDAHRYPSSRLEMSLRSLAEYHFWFGLNGWILLTVIMIPFGKSLVMFRIDATIRLKDYWRGFRAAHHLRWTGPQSGEAQDAQDDDSASIRSWTSDLSRTSTVVPYRCETSSERDIRLTNHRRSSVETVVEPSSSYGSELRNMSGNTVPASWTSLDEELATPSAARLRY